MKDDSCIEVCLVDCIHPKPGDRDSETVEHFAPVAALRLSIELALQRTTSRSVTRLAGLKAVHLHDLGGERGADRTEPETSRYRNRLAALLNHGDA